MKEERFRCGLFCVKREKLIILKIKKKTKKNNIWIKEREIKS